MGQWVIRLWIAAILFLIAVGLHTQAPLVALHCSPDEPHQSGYTAEENCGAPWVLAGRTVVDFARGAVHLIRRYRDEIGALATVAIALFTGTLWWATIRMGRISERQHREMEAANRVAGEAARAAKLSADAAIGSERAWMLLFIDDDNFEVEILNWVSPPENVAALREGGWKGVLRAKLHFENFGRTPAFVKEVSAALVSGEQPPTAIEYKPLAPWWKTEEVIGAGGRLPNGCDDEGEWLHMSAALRGEFGRTHAAAIYEGRGTLYLYGRIVYDDVWGSEHATKFFLANSVYSPWHVPEGCEPYNQRT